MIKHKAKDVEVPGSFPMTKSWAQRLLRGRFIAAQIADRTTTEDRAAGHKRLVVTCTGNYGAKVGVVEVSGPENAVYKAALVAAFRRTGEEIEFGWVSQGGRKMPTVRIVPAKVDPPSSVETQPK